MPDIFQNHTGRMIFLKKTLNLVKIRRNLREILRINFFLFRLILKGIAFIKSEQIFGENFFVINRSKFLAKASCDKEFDSFLEGFL